MLLKKSNTSELGERAELLLVAISFYRTPALISLSRIIVHGPHNYPVYSVTNNVTNHPGERLIIEKNIQISKLLPLCHLLQWCNYYLDRFLSKISTKCLNDGVFCLAACGHIARPL